ncbi:MAG: XRE family transcriptional regulator [Muribaculaceae bacterium]|nr:XRE family transcriptional regulator [Muribaculaceae bacterium]
MKPIGELVKEELMAQERTITWFARKLCIDRSNVYRLFQKNSVDTDLLMRISLVLKKDFFTILARGLEEKRNSQQQ